MNPVPANRFTWPKFFGLAAAFCASFAGRAAEAVSFGPAYAHFGLTLGPGERTEAVGPFYSEEVAGTQATVSYPPFYSREEDPSTERVSWDVLYPLASYDRFGKEYRVHLGQMISWAGGVDQQDRESRRFTLFPFYFRQRSAADPGRNYTAVFPFYGTTRQHMLRDEVKVTLMPLYVQTRKKDLVTDNYLAPFFHVRHGDGLAGWQFWPLVGDELKTITTSTNGFGEVSVVPGHQKFFVMWPFFMQQRLGWGTTNPVAHDVFLPFYRTERSPARDSTSLLFPFGPTFIDDREKGYREVGTPWPFVVFASGPGKTTHRIWPLFGEAWNEAHETDFFLWPLYKHSHIQSAPLDREKHNVFFFLYTHLTERNTESGVSTSRRDLWPFFTVRKDTRGNRRVQCLAVVEPILMNNRSIERNWSPVWSIYRAETNPRKQASSQSLLWNLWRHERTPNASSWSLFFGLLQHRQEGGQARWGFARTPEAPRRLPPAGEAHPH